jgi:hypothetical protein
VDFTKGSAAFKNLLQPCTSVDAFNAVRAQFPRENAINRA